MAEAQQQEIKLNPKSLTHLFKVLAASKKRISDKQRKKEEVMGSIEKIRQAAERTAKKPLIFEELQKIESKVGELAEKQVQEEFMLRKLQQKYGIEKPKPAVKSLEDFERISWRLGENVQKLKKIEEEEKPKVEVIREEKNRINEIKQIEGQLRIAEAKYNRLRKNRKYASDVKRLKELIDRYKKAIQEIKGSK